GVVLRALRVHRRHEGRYERLPSEAAGPVPRPVNLHYRRIRSMTTNNVFSGLKVVDLASFIAGPGAAVILSDFGADVIKVEPPSGDTWRHVHQIPPQPRSKDPYP